MCGIDVWEMIICGIIEGVTLGVGFVCEKRFFDVLVEVCGWYSWKRVRVTSCSIWLFFVGFPVG